MPFTVRAAAETIEALLKQGPKCFRDLTRAIAPLYETADSVPTYQTAHAVLYELMKQGRLVRETVMVPGAKEDRMAPEFMLSLRR